MADSIATLGGGKVEVIVTDDGGGDESKEVVAPYHEWARWVAGPRRGPAANRNSGARHAKGKWLVYIDDDCIPKANLLVAYAGALSDDYLVYEGKTTCEEWRNSPLETAPTNETGGYLWSCNMVVRTDFFIEIGGFDERFPFAGGEDVEFRERLVVLSKPFKWVPEAVVDHPPRPRNLFVKAARREESQIPLLLLKGDKNPYRKVVPNTFIHGLRTLYHARFSTKWIVAASSLLVQSTAMLFMIPAWKRRYGFHYEHPSK